MGSDDDRYAAMRRDLEETVLAGPGETSAALRGQAAAGEGLPPDLQALVEKVHRHAYKVTPEEIAALNLGHSDDALFEVIAAAAVGAARERLSAGLRALAAAGEEEERDATAKAQ